MSSTLKEAVEDLPESISLDVAPTRRQHVHADLNYALQIARIGAVVLTCDLLSLLASYALSYSIVVFALAAPLSVQTLISCWAITTIGHVLSFWLLGLYPAIGIHPATELKHLFRTSLTVGLAVLACAIAFGQGVESVVLVGVAFCIQLFSAPCLRSVARSITRRYNISIPFFFLGDRSEVLAVYRDMHHFGWPMLRPVGRFDNHLASSGISRPIDIHDRFELEFERQAEYLGTADCMTSEARHRNVYWLIRAGQHSPRISPLQDSAGPSFPKEISLSVADGRSSCTTSMISIGLANGLHTEDTLLISSQLFLKRLMDLALATFAVIVLLPAFVLIAALLRLSSRGPIVYASRRIGIGGKVFRAWKFRTMVPDADAVLSRYLDDHPELRAEWDTHTKLKYDPRITVLGRILRRTSLDELPQLFNVLLGQMSLVGPRPMLENEIHRYGDTYEAYLRVTPGITGLWQISGRNNTTYEDRLRYVQIYVRNWSPWMDLYILFRTIKTVLFCEGAY